MSLADPRETLMLTSNGPMQTTPQSGERETLLDRILPASLPPVLLLLLAVYLAVSGSTIGAVASVAVALVCHRVLKAIAARVTRANEQKCSLDIQLIQSQKLASIGELSAGIAHEINNPLAIIGQEIEWVLHLTGSGQADTEPGAAEMKDSLAEISRQVNRCKEITHKLLDLARKKDPVIQPADLNRLLEDMARLVEREAGYNDIRIERDYDADLPPVRTDPPLVRQVVLNLLNNATQAIGRGGVIRLTTRKEKKDRVRIDVGDTGCGIPAEHLNQVFDPFFTTKPPGAGTGLGLSICHGIITKLGGAITVESRVGQGTTFTVTLPAGKETTDVPQR